MQEALVVSVGLAVEGIEQSTDTNSFFQELFGGQVGVIVENECAKLFQAVCRIGIHLRLDFPKSCSSVA